MSDFTFPNWDKISKEEQEIISELLKLDGHVVEGDNIIDGVVSDKGLGTKLCRLACRAATAAAITACGPAAPVCVAAVIAAGEVCYNSC